MCAWPSLGEGGSDLPVLESVLVPVENNRGWMKALAPFLMWVVFVLEGVWALSTSTPLRRCNRCVFQCSSRLRVWRQAGKVLWPPSGCCGSACILSTKSFSGRQSLAGTRGICDIEKEAPRMWRLITPLTWQSKRQITPHDPENTVLPQCCRRWEAKSWLTSYLCTCSLLFPSVKSRDVQQNVRYSSYPAEQ